MQRTGIFASLYLYYKRTSFRLKQFTHANSIPTQKLTIRFKKWPHHASNQAARKSSPPLKPILTQDYLPNFNLRPSIYVKLNIRWSLHEIKLGPLLLLRQKLLAQAFLPGAATRWKSFVTWPYRTYRSTLASALLLNLAYRTRVLYGYG